MCSFSTKKTLKQNGDYSYVLVDEEYKIVEEVALYLNSLELKNMSPNTIRNYCIELQQYFTWLDKNQLLFFDVTKQDMLSWVEFVKYEAGKGKQKMARTTNHYLSVVASFYRYFEGIGGFISGNPLTIKEDRISNFFTNHVSRKTVDTHMFKQKVIKKTNNKRLFRKQIDVLFKGLELIDTNAEIIERNQLLFRVLYETGGRIGETLGLRINDYNLPKSPQENLDFIKFKRHENLYHQDHRLKTNERDIPVDIDLLYAIDNYVCSGRPSNDQFDTIFVNQAKPNEGKFLTRDTIEKLFKRLSEFTGIKCTPHMLRHTHGTELKKLGYDDLYIKERLGHNSLESTGVYEHPSPEAMRDAYAKVLVKRKEVILND